MAALTHFYFTKINSGVCVTWFCTVVPQGKWCSREPLDISAFLSNQIFPSPHTTSSPAHNYSFPTSFFKHPLPLQVKWFVLLVRCLRCPGDTSRSSVPLSFKQGNCSWSPPSDWFLKARKEKTKGTLELGCSLGFVLDLPCSQWLRKSLTPWDCLCQVIQSFRLEKTFEIIKSNCKPNTAKSH